MMDAWFFAQNEKGRHQLLASDATDAEIMRAIGETLRLGNLKNDWKNVCIYQEANRDQRDCPVCTVGRHYFHIRANTVDATTLLLVYFVNGLRKDVTDNDIRKGVKYAAACLDYPCQKGIPIDQIDTHSLQGGGANALALAGYRDTQIQKMG